MVMNKQSPEMMKNCGAHTCHGCGKLNILALGIAGGIMSALGTLLLAWLAASHGLGMPMVEMMGSFYKGFTATMSGAFVGALWGLLHGFIWGVLFGLIYNWSLCMVHCLCCVKFKCNHCEMEKEHKSKH